LSGSDERSVVLRRQDYAACHIALGAPGLNYV
jgi:hypothetical protein